MPLKFQLDRLTLTPVRVRGKSYSKTDRQTDGRTDRQTHRRVVQNHFSRRFEGCTSQIRSYLKLDFLHDANASIDMEVIQMNTCIFMYEGGNITSLRENRRGIKVSSIDPSSKSTHVCGET